MSGVCHAAEGRVLKGRIGSGEETKSGLLNSNFISPLRGNKFGSSSKLTSMPGGMVGRRSELI